MKKHHRPADEAAENEKPQTLEEADTNPPEETSDHDTPTEQPAAGGRLERLWHAYLAKKKLTIPLTILVIILVILAVPMTRLKALGLFIHKDFSVTVVDSETGKPVSEAAVELESLAAKTDGEGRATLKDAPLGEQKLTISKKYYKSTSVEVVVDLSESKNKHTAKLEATGRQVPVVITNRVTGKALKGVSITVLDTEAKTDDKGEATLVVPADKTTEKVTLKLDDYNEATAEIDVKEQLTDKNKLALTPSGKLYFLSKQSGKVDVVKTNLDGTDRQTVLPGTGKEIQSDTVLLASRDWKYLALKSRRDSDKAKLYLIDTATDKLTTIDEGNVEFTLTGWVDNTFVFTVNRLKLPWETNGFAIKSYDAKRKALKTIDETIAVGWGYPDYIQEIFTNIYVVDNTLVYAKLTRVGTYTNYYGSSKGKEHIIVTMRPDGSERKVLRGFPLLGSPSYSDISVQPYGSQEVSFFVYASQGSNITLEYEDGALKEVKTPDNDEFYATYLQSPSGQKTFWFEPRDGKNTLFLGNKEGENAQEIAVLSELTPYGWYTDNYLLTSKSSSELYIMGTDKGAKPLKITDYHKPAYNFTGYGGGYGGF
jgi:hypothetical protein